MDSKLVLYNTLTRRKEVFEPLVPGRVGMYVCGPTVYGDPHLGHARPAVTFDLLFRYLKASGYKVRYVRNITDVGHLEHDADEGEDKIAKKARLEQLEPMEVAHYYTERYHRAMDALNVETPSIEPYASGHIIEQIEFVKRILADGYAYEANGSVYFDVEKYNAKYNYGRLSGRNLDDIVANTRELDGQSDKRHSYDFALWKKASPEHIMRWPSPWGEGFPGWHMECSAMSTRYLGERFDIHGGGMDLMFPHHECEIAQSTAALGHDSARYWLHNNMMTVNGQKMGKSLGNFITLEEFFTGSHPKLSQAYSPMTIRFFVLDEADRMLDMGFIHDIRRILPLLPERRQTLFFSATMPESIAALAAKILRNPVLVTVTPPASVVETIAQTVHFAEKAEKSQLLIDLLSASDAQQVLVFSRTKHGADKLAKILNRAGIRSCAIHGNKSQNARVKAMNDFKSGECRVMIATDIAARGIDIDQLPLVINYELPEVAETYVHRIGRTGRAGHEGAAWSFCSEDEFEYLCDIQKLTGLTIPTEGPVPEYALRKAAPARKPAQKAAQRPARTQEPKPARNAGAKSAQRPARDADAGQQPAQRPARNTEQKAARNAAKTPQSAQNPAQPEAGATSRPSRPRRRRGTRPAPGTPIEPAGKTASRPADATRGQAPKQGSGNAAKAAGNKSAATAAPKNAPNPAPAPSAKPSRRRKRGGSGNAAGSAAAAAAIAAPAATAEAPQKKWWKRWL